MYLKGFDIIADERPDIREELKKVRQAIVAAGPDPVLDPETVADVTKVNVDTIRFVFDRLCNLGDLSVMSRCVCRNCRAVVLSTDDDICQCGADLSSKRLLSEDYFTFKGVIGRTKEFWNDVAAEAKIGIVTALPKEAAAVLRVFDEAGETVRVREAYDVGLVGGLDGDHKVVHATCAQGNTSAAVVGTQLIERFDRIEELIMVGIAGVVPAPTDPENHARLGDVVVSSVKGVVEYDFKKEESSWEEIRCAPTRPAARLLHAVDRLKRKEWDGTESTNLPWITPIERIGGGIGIRRPRTDVLHAASEPFAALVHPRDPLRTAGLPRVHTAPIASSGTLQKNPAKRDQLGATHGVRAIEMEGSGVAEAAWAGGRGYLVIRGGCDYCDKYKTDAWQRYAAVVAAAYLDALLRSLAV